MYSSSLAKENLLKFIFCQRCKRTTYRWHENGVQDLPAMIDYVLETTNNTQLVYAGHSEGTTAFWVMATERPEYQDKVKVMFAMGPIAYVSHAKSPFYKFVAKYATTAEVMKST